MHTPDRSSALSAHRFIDCFSTFVVRRTVDAQGKVSHALPRIRRFHRKELRVDFD
jgi:hypothetical protein